MPEKGALRAVRRRTWLLAALVVTVLVAASATWFAVSTAEDRDELMAARQEQLERGCAGLLPGELSSFATTDGPGVLVEFGTMLRPRQESRALLDCTLSWGDVEDAWEPDAQARVRAEAVLTRTASAPMLDGGFELPLPDSALGSVTTEDRLRGSTVSASLLVDCPKGLTGRVRPARDLLVAVDLPSTADENHVPKDDRLLASRTAADVANWVTRKQGCGVEPLSTEPAGAPAKAPKLCTWLSPEALRFTPGDWTFDGNATTYSRRTGTCGGRWDDIAGSPGELTIKAVGAESWSGVLATGAYDHHQDNGYVPDPDKRTDPGERPDPDKPVTVEESGDDPQLALWARSECVAGPTYHRVTVTPQLDFDYGPQEGRAVLEPEERRRLSRQARAVLDRYLAAPDGWPRRSHCRDTKVMGEVAQWRG
ncbi:hypothetical protein AB0B50_21795 [Streptomyces sp. NPDC041068]|uniref:hypothetical protein n=1 Tax=Streptomyces sp. NPDC041068 TaxID=3155130 RepID=UPI0033C12408